jgi:hypothetical protein
MALTVDKGQCANVELVVLAVSQTPVESPCRSRLDDE